MDALALAQQNLLSPMVLFFILGLAAALARSDLTIPEAVAKTISLYLMMAIGYKGGVGVAEAGFSYSLAATLAAGVALSFLVPVLGYAALRATSRLDRADAAAVSAHYGSISIVTFLAGTQMVESALGAGEYEGFLVAVAAAMETPAILTALFLVARMRRKEGASDGATGGELFREVALNPSVVVLLGALFIGIATGPAGLERTKAFFVDPFQGVLCLFLLDMGLVAGRGLRRGWRELRPPVLAFGIYMPLVSASLAAALVPFLGISAGGATLFIILAASASYIAVPAAMRLALPEAKASIYLTLSLGVTFPFNLIVALPIYLWLAQTAVGA